MNKKHKITIACTAILVVCLICAGLFTSLVKLGSANVPRILYAIAAVNSNESDFIIVKDNGHAGDDTKIDDFFALPNKVIVAAEGYTVYDFAEDEGYEITDQLGSCYRLEKDDQIELLFPSGDTKWFSIWKID